jgi:uncharacterized repeat protein (TIGR01451 family)
MRHPSKKSNTSLSVRRIVVALNLALCIFVFGAIAQEPVPTPNIETIPVGSYVIPMDNVRQGNAGGTMFNLKAYGLANAMLQAGVPLKWVIKYDKATSESTAQVDFTVNATKIGTGIGGGTASGSQAFSGGPFIVYPGYEDAALVVITTFNDSIAGTANDVVVYQTDAITVADIRYTLTHKPLIAYGQGNGMNTDVHQRLYDFAKIPNYVQVDDATVNEGTCVTIASQPHYTTATHVDNYRIFVNSGGNLLLQCKSVETFENVATWGFFQTTNGYGVSNNDDAFRYPNPARAFSQFIGTVQPNQTGLIEDYVRNVGAFQNGTYVVLQTGVAGNNRYGATASKVNALGAPNIPGGMTFYLGGHDYFDGGDGPASNLAKTNAQRMILNAVFVPPTRPEVCGIDLGFPLLEGYKFVRVTDNVWPYNLGTGDTLTWTIVYHNNGSLRTTDVQINDVLPLGFVTLVGTPVVTTAGAAGTTASLNPSYTGVAPNQGLLAPGAFIPPQGTVIVTITTTINPINTGFSFENQTTAFGSNIPATGVLSDSLDGITYIPADSHIPSVLTDSIRQIHSGAPDPTLVSALAPTAAAVSIEGIVRTAAGQGIGRVAVSVTRPSTGEVRTTITNPFGYFRVPDLMAGDFYVISVSHKTYQFAVPSVSFTINDDVTGLVFEAAGGGITRPPGKIKGV